MYNSSRYIIRILLEDITFFSNHCPETPIRIVSLYNSNRKISMLIIT